MSLLQLLTPDGPFDSRTNTVRNTGTNEENLIVQMIGDKDVKEVTIKVFDDTSDGTPATLEDYEVHVCVEKGKFLLFNAEL